MKRNAVRPSAQPPEEKIKNAPYELPGSDMPPLSGTV